MTADLVRLREQLAAQVPVADPAVGAAMRSVPRHLFLPEIPPEIAYRDEAIVTKRNASGTPVSSSSQPAIMAIMLDQLALAPGHRVLEVGAGTGYNAALIREIVGPEGQVTSVDIDPEVAAAATGHLAAAGYPDVTVVAADGAEGFAGHAPYDRLIATVGVSDLTPSWLSQVTADARIVVPLDVHGVQLSVAFGRAGGHWASRSIAPCGFMRMRGANAGSEAVLALTPGLRLQLPEPREVDPAAVAAALAAPPVAAEPTSASGGPRLYWGLNLWLAVRDPRFCGLAEERVPDQQPRLAGMPLSSHSFHATYGIVSDAGGIAVLLGKAEAELVATGFGPDGAALAAELAAQVWAWAAAGRPQTAGLHVDAYPRSGADQPPPAHMLVERPHTRFGVYHA
ncbi:MAG TPA: methyltransferase, FxLD system [Streptosporangiaceae bacterium]